MIYKIEKRQHIRTFFKSQVRAILGTRLRSITDLIFVTNLRFYVYIHMKDGTYGLVKFGIGVRLLGTPKE